VKNRHFTNYSNRVLSRVVGVIAVYIITMKNFLGHYSTRAQPPSGLRRQ